MKTKLTTREKTLIAVGAAVGFLVAFYLLVHEPLLGKLGLLRAEVEQTRRELIEGRKILKKAGELEERVKQAEAEAARVAARVPGREAEAILLYNLDDIESRTGARVTEVKVEEPQQVEGFLEYPVDLTVLGTFQAQADFFAAIEDLPQLVKVTRVSIKSSEDQTAGSNITASYVLKFYVDETATGEVPRPRFPLPGRADPFARLPGEPLSEEPLTGETQSGQIPAPASGESGQGGTTP